MLETRKTTFNYKPPFPLINIKTSFTYNKFYRIIFNVYDDTFSNNDKKRCRCFYTLCDKNTGIIYASITKISEHFKKNNLPASRSSIFHFISRMENKGILYRQRPTSSEKTRQKKTNVYIFLDNPLFKQGEKNKIFSKTHLDLIQKIKSSSKRALPKTLPKTLPKITPQFKYKYLKLQRKKEVTPDRPLNNTHNTKNNNSSRKSNVDFSILHSLKFLDEPKKFWEFYEVHNKLVKNWLIKFPKLTLTKLANNLEYIFNELHFFREAGYIKKDPLGYLYKAMENHGGIIAGKQFPRTKNTSKIKQASTVENKIKEKKSNNFSTIKSLKLDLKIEKYFTEAKINNYWLESHMKGLSPEHIKKNLEYGYFQQCRKQKVFINNPAGYLLSSLRVYNDKRIPKPNDFKSEEQFEQEAKAQQEAKVKVAIEIKNAEQIRNQLVVEKNKLNEKHLNRFQQIINNPNSGQLKELIEAQNEYNQNRIKKTSEDGTILFLYKEILYHTFLKKQGIESKILNEISGVGIRLYMQS